MAIQKAIEESSEFIKREGINGLMLIAIVALLGYYVWTEKQTSERLTDILLSAHQLQRETNDAEELRSRRIGEMIVAQQESTSALNALISIALDKRLSDERKQKLMTDQMRELVDLTKGQIDEKK